MKLLGISPSKIASVVFLLMTLLIALVLSSFEFLKTNNMAEVPVFTEGHEGMEHSLDELPPVELPPVELPPVELPTVKEEKEEPATEGFSVTQNYTLLSEAFGQNMEGFNPKKEGATGCQA